MGSAPAWWRLAEHRQVVVRPVSTLHREEVGFLLVYSVSFVFWNFPTESVRQESELASHLTRD